MPVDVELETQLEALAGIQQHHPMSSLRLRSTTCPAHEAEKQTRACMVGNNTVHALAVEARELQKWG